MRMFDGLVRTLINVKHVPDLKKNLVSLSYFEQSDYSFSSRVRSGGLNISNGAIIVMRCRRMENNLYRMEGSVVTGESDVVAAAQDQQGTHFLWYYRLGHMGDHRMELSKHGLILDLDGGISKNI